MKNADHIVISILLIAGFVALDLVPQIRSRDREKPAVWFAACVYALALSIDLLLGFGVQFNWEKAALGVLRPMFRFLLGGDPS
jgi:hypothetical protein